MIGLDIWHKLLNHVILSMRCTALERNTLVVIPVVWSVNLLENNSVNMLDSSLLDMKNAILAGSEASIDRSMKTILKRILDDLERQW